MWAQIIRDLLEVSMVFRPHRTTRAAKRLSSKEDPEYPTLVLEAGWNPEVYRLRPGEGLKDGTAPDPDPCAGSEAID